MDDKQQLSASLSARLHDAEEILRAIREGEIDALAILSERGPSVHTLSGSEHPYRVLVETMGEGAATLTVEGRILFHNPALARLLGLPPEEITGSPIQRFISPDDLPPFQALLKRGTKDGSKGEVSLVTDNAVVPVLMSVSPLELSDLHYTCLIITDLREQKRNQEILASERLTNSILDQAAEAIVVCNPSGQITRANKRAQALCGTNPVLSSFDECFPLYPAATTPDGIPSGPPLSVMDVLHGRTYTSYEVVLGSKGTTSTRPLLLSAGPLQAADASILGCVVHLIDISERKQAERAQAELLHREQQALAEARMANQAKDVFLATLSHELRTPLSAVLGWVRLLKEADSERIAKHAVEVIERNANAQAKLIDDILDISRIISGKIELEIQVLNLTSVLKVALESARPAAEAKELVLTSHFSNPEMLVHGDAARLQQVIWNLLSNATKFTPRGGSIDVRLDRDPYNFILTVADSGQGIAADFLPFVFDRFRQADGSISRRHGGLGLGLAIVRHLIEMHGGSVQATSDGEGCGSRFTVWLPRAIRSSPSAKMMGAVSGKFLRISTQSEPQSETDAALRDISVLIVDDQPDTLGFLALALQQQGAQVQTASSAEEALQILAENSIDVLISDIAMPGDDGYRLIQKLRAREAEQIGRPGIPAIALTAFARATDAENAIYAGFERHLSKPVDIAKLITAVAGLAKSRYNPAR